MSKQPAGLPVKLDAAHVARIDKLRGLVSRTVYVRYLLDKAIAHEEKLSGRKK